MSRRRLKQWLSKAGDVHVLPMNDLRKHVEAEDCWCQPVVTREKKSAALIVHNAMDGRELVEKHGLQ
jgi:hypothetical protein